MKDPSKLSVMPTELTETQRRFAAIARALAGEARVTLGSSEKKGFGSSALQIDSKIFAMVSSKGDFVVKQNNVWKNCFQVRGGDSTPGMDVS
jgi:hypothetical protein